MHPQIRSHPAPLAAALAALVLAAGLGGCRAPVQPRTQPATLTVPDLTDRPTALTGGQEWLRPEYQRRDADLALAAPRAQLASDQWPQAEPPDIGSPRYIYIRTSERTQLFFVPRSYRYTRP